jgi:hypothetical protein
LVLAISSVDAQGRPVATTSYDSYKEFLLDRIAANYVSFTILEDDDLEQYGTNGNNMDDNESQNSSYFDDTTNPFSMKKKKDSHQMDFQQSQIIRRKFFEQFYDIIAQSVFYALFYAYPKSRGQTLTNELKRKLLNIFSKRFTGMKIQSASYENWYPIMGGGNML